MPRAMRYGVDRKTRLDQGRGTTLQSWTIVSAMDLPSRRELFLHRVSNIVSSELSLDETVAYVLSVLDVAALAVP